MHKLIKALDERDHSTAGAAGLKEQLPAGKDVAYDYLGRRHGGDILEVDERGGRLTGRLFQL